MSLTITLSKNGQATEWNEDTSISFDGDNADYWYLFPTMIKEINNETGESIDLYDNTEFFGDHLSKIEKIIIKQIQALRNRLEEKWEVHIGTQTLPDKKEIYGMLVKNDLANKLEKFLSIVRLANEKDEKVICIGD